MCPAPCCRAAERHLPGSVLHALRHSFAHIEDSWHWYQFIVMGGRRPAHRCKLCSVIYPDMPLTQTHTHAPFSHFVFFPATFGTDSRALDFHVSICFVLQHILFICVLGCLCSHPHFQGVLKLLYIQKQSVCMRSKGWRCRARVTLAAVPVLVAAGKASSFSAPASCRCQLTARFVCRSSVCCGLVRVLRQPAP